MIAKDDCERNIIHKGSWEGVCAAKSTPPTPRERQNEKSNFPIGVSFVLRWWTNAEK